jgi:hypothetical protein
MTMDDHPTLPIDVPKLDEPEAGDDEFAGPSEEELRRPESPHPVNWNVLTAEEAVQEWFALDAWVNWLRRSYGLPVTIISPYWHRHPELVWELSALHLHWLGAYDPEQEGSAPVAWHADFAAARERLRDWTAIAGTKLDSDRPTRPTTWPGEESAPDQAEHAIVNREKDFAQFVKDDFAARRAAEETFFKDAAVKPVVL